MILGTASILYAYVEAYGDSAGVHWYAFRFVRKFAVYRFYAKLAHETSSLENHAIEFYRGIKGKVKYAA